MRTAGYLIAASAFLLQLTSQASAVTFNWSYTGVDTSVFGSGTLTATQEGTSDTYDVNTIMGTANFGTTQYAIDSVSLFYSSPDNNVYFNLSAPPHFDPSNTYFFVDFRGLAFTGPDGVAFELYEDNGALINVFPSYACGAPYCLIGPGDPTNLDGTATGDTITKLSDVSLTLADAVPEPSTWAMMILGFVGIGAMTYRRRKSAMLAA
jgi:hypothetical protein